MAYVITIGPSITRYAVTTTEYCGSGVYHGGGMQMPDANGEIQRKQPYKFGGKEHLSAGGLNIHDFGQRALYAPAGQFSSADPKCEDYPPPLTLPLLRRQPRQPHRPYRLHNRRSE